MLPDHLHCVWTLPSGDDDFSTGWRLIKTIFARGRHHRVFEQVLFSGGVRLMVIGYGWGDEHINDIIADAVRDHELQVYS